jgi:hypothetical protein
MNTAFRKPLPGAALDYYDTRAAVDAIAPGAYDTLPYTSRVLAEQLVRRCDPAALTDSLKQLIERKRDLDFPWYPARVVCHDILGQTALVDLAGLRDAIADQGGDPSLVNPVVPTQLIVDHSLAVECGGFDQDGRHSGVMMSSPTSAVRNVTFDKLFSFSDIRNNYKHISNENWSLIVRGQVAVGMTKEECTLSLGAPQSVDRVPTHGGLLERWVYDNGVYLVFADGILERFRQ